MSAIFPLIGVVKNYDWGGHDFIPSLLGIKNENQLPFAEYWLGTHALGPSTIELPNGDTKPFTSLGNSLPFLLKMLDVKEMLSIQVHPSSEVAEKGFMREEKEGIALTATNRVYKDRFHKPELMVALSDFWLLQGFRPAKEIAALLNEIDEFKSLIPVFEKGGVQALYRFVMEMPQEKVDTILQKRLQHLEEKADSFSKNEADYWVLKAANRFCSEGKMDRGIFSIYFFNLVHLKKGEAVFQNDEMPHAYLEGQNVEIMANSDNVLRGGLTNKHIDVAELLRNINCQSIIPEKTAINLESDREEVFITPVNEFKLSRFILQKGEQVHLKTDAITIFLLTEGRIEITDATSNFLLEQGHLSVVVLPGRDIQISAKENAIVFKATSGHFTVE